jgi:mono/diheme cytochrome c family protein
MQMKTPMKTLTTALTLALLLAATVQAAEPAKTKAKAPKPTTELLVKGRASFEASCATCHGSSGDGMGPAGQYLNPKPRHFTNDKFKQGSSVEEIFMTLQTGVKDTPMVTFAHLSEDERWALSYYVLSFVPSKDGKKVKKTVDALPPLAAPAAPAQTPGAPVVEAPAPATAPVAGPAAPK